MESAKLPPQRFTFQPRWKEQLIVTQQAGSFILDMPMGELSVYLPPEGRWKDLAPAWAQDDWLDLKDTLAAWCLDNKVSFCVDRGATVTALIPQQ